MIMKSTILTLKQGLVIRNIWIKDPRIKLWFYSRDKCSLLLRARGLKFSFLDPFDSPCACHYYLPMLTYLLCHCPCPLSRIATPHRYVWYLLSWALFPAMRLGYLWNLCYFSFLLLWLLFRQSIIYYILLLCFNCIFAMLQVVQILLE